MAGWTLPEDGGCRCGKVRFRITDTPLLTMLCHCVGCQKMTGSAYSASVMIAETGFELTAGEMVIGGLHGDLSRHNHCDWCKSWVCTKIPLMGFVNVRATMLDDTTWFVPFVESYTSEALPWAVIGAAHTYAEFPPADAYQMLLGDFAALNK